MQHAAQIVGSSVAAVSKRTDRFASPIFRVTVTSTSSRHPLAGETTLSFVLKVPATDRPTDDNGARVLFDNEIRFYSTTLEEMHRLLKHSEESVALGPRFALAHRP